MGKIQVYHFNNGTEGGVLMVIKNLLRFSVNNAIENHIIYTINKTSITNFSLQPVEGVSSQQVFYYTGENNFYYTCKKLACLLPDDKAIIVAHDWLELGMVSNLGLQNRVIFFVHGDYDYYYRLAVSHQNSIDKFFSVASNISLKLKLNLPERSADICYLRFPVPSVTKIENKNPHNNIIFIGRLTKEKGYNLLHEIDKLLKIKNIFLQWHIVGQAEDGLYTNLWPKSSSVKLYGNIENTDVLRLLRNMDYYILPSLREGMPVALIEAMKSGVIPFVNDIEGGIQEMVKNNFTGYKITGNNVSVYVERIAELVNDKHLSAKIISNCIEKANNLFDPVQNTNLIETEILKMNLAPQKKKVANRVYGSRLDQLWLPNSFTKFIRGNK